MRRRQLSASKYGRCGHCNRLTEKDSLKPGPDGVLYGPDCLIVVIRQRLSGESHGEGQG